MAARHSKTCGCGCLGKGPEAVRAVERAAQRAPDGYVYVIHAPEQGYVRIGFSRWPALQLKGLQRQCPVKVRMAYVFAGSASMAQALRARFKHLRAGAWYAGGAERGWLVATREVAAFLSEPSTVLQDPAFVAETQRRERARITGDTRFRLDNPKKPYVSTARRAKRAIRHRTP